MAVVRAPTTASALGDGWIEPSSSQAPSRASDAARPSRDTALPSHESRSHMFCGCVAAVAGAAPAAPLPPSQRTDDAAARAARPRRAQTRRRPRVVLPASPISISMMSAPPNESRKRKCMKESVSQKNQARWEFRMGGRAGGRSVQSAASKKSAHLQNLGPPKAQDFQKNAEFEFKNSKKQWTHRLMRTWT